MWVYVVTNGKSGVHNLIGVYHTYSKAEAGVYRRIAEEKWLHVHEEFQPEESKTRFHGAGLDLFAHLSPRNETRLVDSHYIIYRTYLVI